MAASDYNRLIPLATDQLNISQSDLLLNFGAIADLIDVDHVDFANANAGKHAKVTFPAQTVAPTFIGGEVGLFNLNYPVTTTNELYLNTFQGDQFPITAGILSTNANPGTGPGWMITPSGMILKWGNSTATGSTTFPFPVSANIPVFTAVSSVQISTLATGGADLFAQLVSRTATQITVYGSQRTTTTVAAVPFEYLAIGY